MCFVLIKLRRSSHNAQALVSSPNRDLRYARAQPVSPGHASQTTGPNFARVAGWAVLKSTDLSQ